MNDGLIIRKYIKADLEKLVEIFNLNVPKNFDPKELDYFIDYFEKNADTYFTLESGNRIIGGVGYEIRESDKSGRINWIFLHPDFVGAGHGKAAAEHCLKILRSDPGAEVLIVRTSQLAYKFFERLGYNLVQTEKDHWGKGLDLYLMNM